MLIFTAAVKLVKPREDGSRLVVSTRQTDRAAPDDLVILAQQLTSARYDCLRRFLGTLLH